MDTLKRGERGERVELILQLLAAGVAVWVAEQEERRRRAEQWARARRAGLRSIREGV